MNSFLRSSEPSDTAVPGHCLTQEPTPDLCTRPHSPTPLAVLIDQRRQLAAKLAGKDMEIAMVVGDRDAAHRARKEMEAQTVARHAARHGGCYFDAMGQADRAKLRGEVTA